MEVGRTYDRDTERHGIEGNRGEQHNDKDHPTT